MVHLRRWMLEQAITFRIWRMLILRTKKTHKWRRLRSYMCSWKKRRIVTVHLFGSFSTILIVNQEPVHLVIFAKDAMDEQKQASVELGPHPTPPGPSCPRWSSAGTSNRRDSGCGVQVLPPSHHLRSVFENFYNLSFANLEQYCSTGRVDNLNEERQWGNNLFSFNEKYSRMIFHYSFQNSYLVK